MWEDEGVSTASSTDGPGPPAEGVAEGVSANAAAMDWHVPRLFAAWGVAAVIGVFVTVFAGEARASWLVLAVGVATLASFALQLGTAQREGFISRLSFSIAGSVVVIAVVDIVGLVLQSLRG